MKTTWKLTQEVELTSDEFLVVGVVALGIYAIRMIVQATICDGPKDQLPEELALGIELDSTSASSADPIEEIYTSDTLEVFPLRAEATHGRSDIWRQAASPFQALSCFPYPPPTLPHNPMASVYTNGIYQSTFPAYTNSRYYWVVQW